MARGSIFRRSLGVLLAMCAALGSARVNPDGFFTGSPEVHGVAVAELAFAGEMPEGEMAAVVWPRDLDGPTAPGGAVIPMMRSDAQVKGKPVWRLPARVPPGRALEFTVGSIRLSPEALRPGAALDELTTIGLRSGTLNLVADRHVRVRLPEPAAEAGPAGRLRYEIDGASGEAELRTEIGSDWANAVFTSPPGPFTFDVELGAGDGRILTRRGERFRTPLVNAWVQDRQVFAYEPAAEIAPPRFEEITRDWDGRGPRTVRVLLPRGYDAHADRRYPLLYWHDGQNVFAGSRSERSMPPWEADLAARRLTERGEMADVVMVAIDNTDRRMVEYVDEGEELFGRLGQANEYLELIRDRIHPVIRANYRVADDPDQIGIAGSSLGGTVTLYLGWQAPDFARRLGVVSPAFSVVDATLEDIRAHAAEGKPRPPLFIYMDSGTEGRGQDAFAETVEARNLLLRAGYILGYDLYHRVGHGHEHHETAWRERTPEMLRLLFPAGDLFLRQGGIPPGLYAARQMLRPEAWTPPAPGEAVTYEITQGRVERWTFREVAEEDPGIGIYDVMLTASGMPLRREGVRRRWRPELTHAVDTVVLQVGDREVPAVAVREPFQEIPTVAFYSTEAPSTRLVRQVHAETGEVLRELRSSFEGGQAPAHEQGDEHLTPE